MQGVGIALLLGLAVAATVRADPLVVCATTSDLGALVREVGGDRVDLTVFGRGREDPHFVEPRPSFVRRLARADAFVQAGLELEVGWVPSLLRNARNRRVLPGVPGHIDASAAIEPLGASTGPVDRSAGDLHASGNPHYLVDPRNGLHVAALLRDRLSALAPEHAEAFSAGYASFEARLESALKDWAARLEPHRGTQMVAYHTLWPYLARRFGLEVFGHLEPRPGIPPTTRHLSGLVERMRSEGVTLLVVAAYTDPKPTARVADATGARVARLAHQVDAVDGTGDYLSWIEHNVARLEQALSHD